MKAKLVMLTILPILCACGGPSKSDLAELIEKDKVVSFTEIQILEVANENDNWISVMGTAKIRDQHFRVLKRQEIEAYCGLTESSATLPPLMVDGKRTYLVEATIEPGTPVTFTIGMAPDKATQDDRPEDISSGGWTNGAWNYEYDVKGWGRLGHRTSDWFGETPPVVTETPEADALCSSLRQAEK